MNGTPQEVLAHPDLMALMTPMLRADFKVVETYAPFAGPPLACPIVAFGGESDSEASKDEIAAWREATIADFRLTMLPGDHFFLNAQRDRLLSALAAELRRLPV